jgi:hypothetical protein
VTVGFAITPLHRNHVFLTVENNKIHQIYLALYFNKPMQNHTSIGHQQLFASNITVISWLCPWSSKSPKWRDRKPNRHISTKSKIGHSVEHSSHEQETFKDTKWVI